MRVPTPVTNSVIVEESGSTRNRKSARKPPDSIQVKPSLTCWRCSGGSDRSAKNAITDARNASAIVIVASQPAFGSPIRLPNSSRIAAPTAGSSGITHARSSTSRAVILLALQEVDVVGRDILSAPEDGHDDRQTDGHFGGGDDEREEHDHLPADVIEC